MKLSVNANQTIKNFGHVFSDSFKVIQELIQNARRAGATQVDITMVGVYNDATITITDNGSGIDDFSALFVLSQSGWPADVKASEIPFGMGFLSTLYCAKKVTVQSKGGRIEIDTASAIAMEDFGDVQADPAVSSGAVVTLCGVDIPSLYSKLEKLARTSSIAITFNGELLARPYAFTTLQGQFPVVDTPFGKLVLIKPFYENFSVIVQDLVVAKNFRYDDAEHNILFADSNLVRVRMPDRDAIIDSSDFIAQFEAWLKTFFKSEIALLREEMANDIAFLDKFYFEVLRYEPSLLNDIPYLPADAFTRVPYPAMVHDEYSSDEDLIPYGVHQGDAVIIADHDYDVNESNNALIATYLHQKKAQVVMNEIPEDHWIFSQVTRFNVTDFKVEVANPVPFSYGHGKFLCAGNGLACDDIHITYLPMGDVISAISFEEGGSRAINFVGLCQHVYARDKSRLTQNVYTQGGEALDVSDKSIIAIKDVGCYESLLCQLEHYYDDDLRMEDELSDDDSYLQDQIKVSCGGDIGEILTSLIGTLSPEMAARLNGKTASVKFINGEVIFDIAA